MPPPDPLALCTDEELLTRFRSGQQEAFGLLVRRYERDLYGYLRRYLRDDTLADDVFQNTFLQVVSKVGQYDSSRPARPWLYAIAHHQAIDALRRAGRHALVSLDAGSADSGGANGEGNGESGSLLDLLQGRTPDPLDHVQGEERRLLVRQSVDGLPDLLRQVVVLAYYQGWKYREIADSLGIPVGTVKSRLHAALLKLQEAWGVKAPPDGGSPAS